MFNTRLNTDDVEFRVMNFDAVFVVIFCNLFLPIYKLPSTSSLPERRKISHFEFIIQLILMFIGRDVVM